MDGTKDNPRVTSPLDTPYLRAAIRASFLGILRREPTDDEYAYWVSKAQTPDEFSDNVFRVGWNHYWETRIDGTASSNPAFGDEPAYYRPDDVHSDTPNHEDVPPEADPFATELLSVLGKIHLEIQETNRLLMEQKTDVVAALKEASDKLGKIKWPF
jgi:hypothetical protein